MKTNMNLKTRRQTGATLLEMLGYLTLAGVVIGGTATLLTGAFAGQKSNQLSVETEAIVTQVKKMHATSSNYGTVSLNAALITSGGLPKSLRTTAPSTITNAWGGAIVITGATSQFTISNAAIPQDVCAQGLSAMSGGDWSAISVNGTALALPTTAAAAATACNAATNTILLTVD